MRSILAVLFATLTAMSSFLCEGASAEMVERPHCFSVDKSLSENHFLEQNLCLAEVGHHLTLNESPVEMDHESHSDCSHDCFGCCHHFMSLNTEEMFGPQSRFVVLLDPTDLVPNVNLDGPFQPPKS